MAIFFEAADQSFSALGAIGDFGFYFNLLGGQMGAVASSLFFTGLFFFR
jgi:hypothetical protein